MEIEKAVETADAVIVLSCQDNSVDERRVYPKGAVRKLLDVANEEARRSDLHYSFAFR